MCYTPDLQRFCFFVSKLFLFFRAIFNRRPALPVADRIGYSYWLSTVQPGAGKGTIAAVTNYSFICYAITQINRQHNKLQKFYF